MIEPLKAGDTCRVIAGLAQKHSPNIGKVVTVGHRIMGDLGMDHSQFGPVHRCNGEGVKQLGDNGEFFETGWADFPDAWLEKIDPPPLKVKEEVAELVRE